MKGIISFLYKLARGANDLQTLTSGKPKKVIKRGKNKLIGRKVASKLYKWPF